ncbi:MAG: DUF4145 domain-containing protein [Bacteroidota bacterium]
MYYQPDPIWTMFQINSEEEYVEKFVFKARFLPSVPEDIQKSYDIVEHLMAYSYYHYYLYNEAFIKLLQTFELTIKLKCISVGIPMEEINRKGKSEKIKLYKLIDTLSQHHVPQELKNTLHNLRSLRNYYAHPESYSNMGTLGRSNIVFTLNLINQLFLSNTWLKDQKEALKQIEKLLSPCGQKLFVFDHQGRNILIHDLKAHAAICVDKQWVFALELVAVLNDTYQMLSNQIVPDPILVFINNFTSTKNGVTIKLHASNESKLLELTSKEANLQMKQKHIAEFFKLDEMNKFTFRSSQSHSISDKIQEFIYLNCWE